jgi:hypothetical protein
MFASKAKKQKLNELATEPRFPAPLPPYPFFRAIITAKDSKNQTGMINRAQISELWSSFPAETHDLLIFLMEKFEFLQKVPNSTQKEYLVPVLFNEIPVTVDLSEFEDTNGVIRYEWSFDFLLAGSFSRIQVDSSTLVSKCKFN